MAKKPTVTVFVDCPCCKAELKVDVWKRRVGTPDPAEYDINTLVDVVKQGKLFEGADKPAADAAADAA